jgi:diguanylate cyclase (GGDEF)-like protein
LLQRDFQQTDKTASDEANASNGTFHVQKTFPVLLVEDNMGDARLVEEMLGEASSGSAAEYEVSHVERLSDARKLLMESGAGCVLLDLSLPDASRLEALMQLRAAAPDVPIVILSGLQDELLAVKAVQEGAQDYLIKGRVDPNLLSRSINYAIERKRAEMDLTHQAMHDPLTGLPNRTLLLDRIGHALTRAKRHGSLVGVLFIDLDGFKPINDRLGHEIGDKVLMTLAHRLQEVLRTSDTAARLGGDEFVILCEDLASERDVIRVAERVLSATDVPFVLGQEKLYVTASMGIVVAQAVNADPEGLIRDADAAMYRAKELGTSYEMFDEEMRSRVGRRVDTEAALRRALGRDEFRIIYQPQVDLRSGEIFGVEALLRWDHPERGLLEPADFMWLAEESGLLTEVGAWELREVCSQVKRWRQDSRGGSAPRIAVNLSARQHSDPQLPRMVEHALNESATEPGFLSLEITESVVMKNYDAALLTLKKLKGLGVQLALDNFGAANTSLSSLKRLPVDAVKIDRSFVSGLGRDTEDEAIVTAVINLARALGLTTVAQGVETADQVSLLKTMGCDVGQGFYFGRPRPGEAISELLGK